MLKHIKIAALLLCFSLPLMFWGIVKNVRFAQTLSRGNYFFENTRVNTDVHSFILSFPNGNVITLEQKNNLWRIKEADDYYADFNKINTFIGLIRNTTIYRADEIEDSSLLNYKQNALSIQALDSSDKIIDDAHIVPKKDVNKFHYATLNDKNILYQLNNSFDLSPHVMDWVKMPLLAISYDQIKSIQGSKFTVSRRFASENLKNIEDGFVVPQIQNLISQLWYLGAEDIKHALHFNRSQYQLVQTFNITTFDGIIYIIDVLLHDNEYWLHISLDREMLISPEVLYKIKENSMLYDGWFFKINSQVGEVIANFTI